MKGRYLDYGKNQEALKYFDQSLETLPNNPDAFVNKAIALMNLGRKPEALETMFGGSVKSSNAKELFTTSDIDGGLVGGASLKPEEFAKIVNYME